MSLKFIAYHSSYKQNCIVFLTHVFSSLVISYRYYIFEFGKIPFLFLHEILFVRMTDIPKGKILNNFIHFML
jgi:hypothetical protein